MVLRAQMQALNEAGVARSDRVARCPRCLRDKIAFPGRASSVCATTARPFRLSPNDANAWTTGAALLDELEAGYRTCLADAAPGLAAQARSSRSG